MASLPDRPKALTEEVQDAILDGLALGMHLGPACFRAKIDPKSVTYWQRLVENEVEHAQVYADFFQKIKQALALSEELALTTLKAGQPGWQAQAWFLERRFPQRWGRKDRVEKAAPKEPTVIQVQMVEAAPLADTDD